MERAIRHPIAFEWAGSTGGPFKTLLIVSAVIMALYALGVSLIGEPFISAFSDLISILH